MKSANLILIDPVNNHNRVYNMTDIGSGIIKVEMGRQGATLVEKKYPVSQWDNLYKKKINEGYVDRVKEFSLNSVRNSTYRPIDDDTINNFVEYLISCSRKFVKNEVSIDYNCVSEKMINEAQDIIGNLVKETDLDEAIKKTERLFCVIPRKMKNVSENLPKSRLELSNILLREQSLLDAIKTVKKTDAVEDDKKTILEINNLEVREVSKEEEVNIKKHLTSESEGLYKRAFRVINKNTDDKFYQYMERQGMTDKNVHYYYHGSSDANYWGIITEGLSINPKAPVTGKMFGYGIYFAPRARKSIGYTDLAGSYWRGGYSSKAYLAVFKVCYKNPKHTQTCRGFHGLTHLSDGKDATYAHKGAELYNDEVIIYNESQCTIQYLIELEKR